LDALAVSVMDLTTSPKAALLREYLEATERSSLTLSILATDATMPATKKVGVMTHHDAVLPSLPLPYLWATFLSPSNSRSSLAHVPIYWQSL
jgi:hypothetical protein